MAKAQTKAAPAPAEVAGEIQVGSFITFKGYAQETPKEEQILNVGAEYEVIELPTEVDGEMTGYVIQLANPDFNKKKKAHPDTNPEFLETEVFDDEITFGEVVAEQGAAGGEAGSEEEEEEPLTYEELAGYDKPTLLEFAKANEVKLTAADKKTEASLIAKLAAEFGLVPAEEEAEPEPETPPAKPETAAAKKKRLAAEAAEAEAAAKAAAKPTKGAAATKAPAKGAAAGKSPEGEVDPDEVPDLEGEDENVLALIDGADDLVAVAQDLESSVSATEYQLGGVLYHIKKEKAHLAVDKKGKLINPEYGEPGGFKKFLMDNFNLDYRKATYLIDIYINFTLAGLENPSEIVGRIGWTKASKIAKLVGNPDSDVERLIEAAETNTVSDLSTIIKDEFTPGGGENGNSNGAPKAKRITLTFRYVEEEANVVEDVLRDAAEKLGVKPEEALFQILADYHARSLAGGEEQEEEQEEAPPARGGRAAAARGATKGRSAARA